MKEKSFQADPFRLPML